MARMPAEIATACVYWVLERAAVPLSKVEIARRVRAMTPAQVNEARREHAIADANAAREEK